MLLRVEKHFSSSRRCMTECFKGSFYHSFLELMFCVASEIGLDLLTF